MGYAEKIRSLLAPLGVYSFEAGSFSLGEAEALGGELDEAEAALGALAPETLIDTASVQTLQKWESLLRSPTAAASIAKRRQALLALLRVGGGSFTINEINRAVQGCGVNALVTETGPGTVRVSFPGLMGVPEGIDKIKLIVLDILPCHLGVEFFYRYLTWSEAAGLSWGEAGAYTWGALKLLDIDSI